MKSSKRFHNLQVKFIFIQFRHQNLTTCPPDISPSDLMRTVRTEDRILAVPAEMSTLSSDLGQPIKIDDSGI